MKLCQNRADMIVLVLCVILIGFIMFTLSCGKKELVFESKPLKSPSPIYCFDSVGHKKGAGPFVLGGTCCCTPTEELVAQYHRDGHIRNTNLDGLIKLYEEKNIKTALEHQGCNNLCQWGPHVVKGGYCMVPPTPGTANFEEVRSGYKYVLVESKKSK